MQVFFFVFFVFLSHYFFYFFIFLASLHLSSKQSKQRRQSRPGVVTSQLKVRRRRRRLKHTHTHAANTHTHTERSACCSTGSRGRRITRLSRSSAGRSGSDPKQSHTRTGEEGASFRFMFHEGKDLVYAATFHFVTSFRPINDSRAPGLASCFQVDHLLRPVCFPLQHHLLCQWELCFLLYSGTFQTPLQVFLSQPSTCIDI